MTLDPETRKKIDQLVASDSVVLFMKGSRSFPQCGFSASVVNILNTLIPKYTTVNILSDADVRTLLAKFGLGFLFSAEWDPVKEDFGALVPIYGTLMTSLKSTTVAPQLELQLKFVLMPGNPSWGDAAEAA